ncbi:nucleotidyl transferase AbiEii/AbiGii toxin family protein [Shewanella surugensis]|uniref:Nucleotidyl transferase AbiEii/AbiGii toxin family protein n=1 Tax=Shewanella surugensis TaxID=212020 RepID=A0ABT0LK37_9GAMM|nr:nucleotidyl transferase AbiEii/AbiGii toxin family protein [Shewanella surugensis]MCL1128048.1 nucleotidyl transferase AbiEii/AbiGii toxin family protein [Shewanella surugensis]
MPLMMAVYVLFYDEKLLGEFSVAFKGGTALSKCWEAISRFSEDIDLSIHWADLSGHTEEEELAVWAKRTQSRSQNTKFRKAQQKKLQIWSENLVVTLNERLSQYNIEGLYAEMEDDSDGEKIDIHFPRVTKGTHDYQLDHILLEFGGRNRGKPTNTIAVDCYLRHTPGLESLILPQAKVSAYQAKYILWEKLTALHQFCTQKSSPNPDRLSRHWYDVDCLLTMTFADPLNSETTRNNVIEMKKHRWASPGVNYEEIIAGNILLIPDEQRVVDIAKDHENAIKGGMFFTSYSRFWCMRIKHCDVTC